MVEKVGTQGTPYSIIMFLSVFPNLSLICTLVCCAAILNGVDEPLYFSFCISNFFLPDFTIATTLLGTWNMNTSTH
jgi:hypothetical protein